MNGPCDDLLKVFHFQLDAYCCLETDCPSPQNTMDSGGHRSALFKFPSELAVGSRADQPTASEATPVDPPPHLCYGHASLGLLLVRTEHVGVIV